MSAFSRLLFTKLFRTLSKEIEMKGGGGGDHIHNNEYKNITNNNNNNIQILWKKTMDLGWIKMFSCRPILFYVSYFM